MKILKNHRMKNLGGGNSDKIASVLFPLNDNLQEKVLITLDKTCHLNDFCFAQIRIDPTSREQRTTPSDCPSGLQRLPPPSPLPGPQNKAMAFATKQPPRPTGSQGWEHWGPASSAQACCGLAPALVTAPWPASLLDTKTLRSLGKGLAGPSL